MSATQLPRSDRSDAPRRRLPIGAELVPDGAHLRVWAPRRRRVAVAVEGGPRIALDAEAGGYFSGLAPGLRAGARYRFALDDDERLYPDPASRFQPEGPHGPSEVVDPRAFAWTDAGWRGACLRGQVLYELHVGTFTPAGTYDAAAAELPALAEVGITAIELMPLAEFPGRFGWGYDGVDLFAPTRLYGRPDELRRFVDRAHALGLAVILDVVYNHLGPDGNYLEQFAPHYFTDRRQTEWGEPFDFDGPASGPVREYVLANVRHWISEYHLDGLRLDATQAIFDDSPDPIVAAIAREARAAAGERGVIVIGENEPQDAALVRPPESGGAGLDALWNDDFHHSARVALSGRSDAYYSDYRGSPQELVSAVKRGFLYQGQRYRWQNKRRGAPTRGLPPEAFVVFLQNHDQVANSLRGQRCQQQASPGCWRAMTALLLLAPGTPLLFQGQEYAASTPFHYFADHEPELAAKVHAGRRQFLAQFRDLGLPEIQRCIPDPADPATFRASTLDPGERARHREAVALHRDLLRLRREDPVLRRQAADGIDGAVLSDSALVLRYFDPAGEDRLLLVNLGADLHLDPAPEPLLAPPAGARGWALRWSSEDHAYGGCGTPPLDTDDNWRLPGRSAVLLSPETCLNG